MIAFIYDNIFNLVIRTKCGLDIKGIPQVAGRNNARVSGALWWRKEMSADLVAWLGITITVIALVAGFFFAKQIRKRKQIQTARDGSLAIQSGRDTKIGK